MGLGPELGQNVRGILKPLTKPTQMVRCPVCRGMVDDRKPSCTSVVTCNERGWKSST